MESVFYGFETLKFKQMKKIEENLIELLEVFDGNGIPNNTWVKDKLEETLILVKNCSIPDVVGRSEQLVCPNCNSLDITDRIFKKECLRCGQKFKAN